MTHTARRMDHDGDRVEFSDGPGGICVAVVTEPSGAASSRDELCAGPFSIGELRSALDEVAPLDETRLPRVVTDGMVAAGHRAWMDSSTFASPSDKVHAVITAALSTAPTTDEDDGRMPGREFRARFLSDDRDYWKARAEKAEQERDMMRDGWNVTSNEKAALESMTARDGVTITIRCEVGK